METETNVSSVILSEEEAAQRVFVQRQTMRSWRHRGRGPKYLKLSGRIRYRLSDLEEFIANSVVTPGAPNEKGKRKRKAA